MLSSLSPARRRLVLCVVALVVAMLLGGVALAVGTARGRADDPAARPADQSRPGPVLLVPGYGGSTASLEPLAAGLRRLGRTVQVVTLPDGGLGDLTTQARALGAAAQEARSRSGAASVDVVGYSAGGVVARLWVRDLGGAALARRVVTLGSPQHGTELAGLGQLVQGRCPLACQQLSPTSPVLAALNEGDETPPGPQWVSIWTTHDDVVLPPESARLDGAVDIAVQSVCRTSVVRHSGLPADPAVIAMVADELGTSPVRQLTAKDCRDAG